jgi:hypothetical protein
MSSGQPGSVKFLDARHRLEHTTNLQFPDKDSTDSMTQWPVTEDVKSELLKQSVECALQQEQAKQSRGWITRFTLW